MDVLQAVALAQRLAHRRRGVRQSDKVEPLAFLPQVESMLRLANQAGADQTNAQSLHVSPSQSDATHSRMQNPAEVSAIRLSASPAVASSCSNSRRVRSRPEVMTIMLMSMNLATCGPLSSGTTCSTMRILPSLGIACRQLRRMRVHCSSVQSCRMNLSA